jgi:hypothetical protein
LRETGRKTFLSAKRAKEDGRHTLRNARSSMGQVFASSLEVTTRAL